MLYKLSLKIGLLFFLVIMTVEIILFYILYTNLVEDRVEEVMRDLLSRGNAHSHVLEENYNSSTIEHVAIMESESEFIVVITDPFGEIITSSNPSEPIIRTVVEHTDHDGVPEGGVILESDWSNEPYVSTDSPVTIDGSHVGHVFMFADSNNIKRIIDQLSQQFLLLGVLTVFLTIITVFILSRVVTQPLIKMKKATEHLSRGHHEIELNTERKDELGELATSISTLSKDLERLKNERNEFLGSISHELRTPLTYLKGYTDILSREDISIKNRNQYISIIQEETSHLVGLIQNLFELAKIDHNEFAISKEKIALENVIHTVVRRIQPAIDEKSITFTFDCPDNLVAYVDPFRIRQVLLNILDNAIKYTPFEHSIKMEVSENNNEILIIISDTGEGIPEEDVPYIFERLYRVDKSRSRANGGSGLGLTIAKEIVELHGGDIRVESAQGKGTVFIVSLLKGVANEQNPIDR